MQSRLELRQHGPARSASTAKDLGQVRAVHSCLFGKPPYADRLAALLDAFQHFPRRFCLFGDLPF
jgi:hypothetical protein